MVGQECGDLPVSQIPSAKVGLWVRASESLSTTMGGRGSGVFPPFPLSVPALTRERVGTRSLVHHADDTPSGVPAGLAVPRNPGPRCSTPSFFLPSAAPIAQHDEKGHPHTMELQMSEAAEGLSLPASLNLDASRPLLEASPPQATLPPSPWSFRPFSPVRSPALPGQRLPNTSLATSEGNSMIRAAQEAA